MNLTLLINIINEITSRTYHWSETKMINPIIKFTPVLTNVNASAYHHKEKITLADASVYIGEKLRVMSPLYAGPEAVSRF